MLPVISLKDDYAHGGSLGTCWVRSHRSALLENLSNYHQVNDKTPPAFLFHTNEDKGGPSRECFGLLQRAGSSKTCPPKCTSIKKDRMGSAGGREKREPRTGESNGSLVEDQRVPVDGQRSEVTGSVTLDGKPLRWGSIPSSPRPPMLRQPGR